MATAYVLEFIYSKVRGLRSHSEGSTITVRDLEGNIIRTEEPTYWQEEGTYWNGRPNKETRIRNLAKRWKK